MSTTSFLTFPGTFNLNDDSVIPVIINYDETNQLVLIFVTISNLILKNCLPINLLFVFHCRLYFCWLNCRCEYDPDNSFTHFLLFHVSGRHFHVMTSIFN